MFAKTSRSMLLSLYAALLIFLSVYISCSEGSQLLSNRQVRRLKPLMAADTIERKVHYGRQLQAWLVSNGGYVHTRVSGGYTMERGYDLRATGLVRAGEVICAIPEGLIVRILPILSIHQTNMSFFTFQPPVSFSIISSRRMVTRRYLKSHSKSLWNVDLVTLRSSSHFSTSYLKTSLTCQPCGVTKD